MITRTIASLTGIPLEIWEVTGIVLESAFTDILDGGASGTSNTYGFTGGNSFTSF